MYRYGQRCRIYPSEYTDDRSAFYYLASHLVAPCGEPKLRANPHGDLRLYKRYTYTHGFIVPSLTKTDRLNSFEITIFDYVVNIDFFSSASKTAKFFYRDVDSTYPFWRLKTPEEHELETGIKSKEARKYIFNCLDDIGQVKDIEFFDIPFGF